MANNMIGKIQSYDVENKNGTILSGSSLFKFDLENWKQTVEPEEGDDVSFELQNDAVTNVDLVGAYLQTTLAVKSKHIASVLALLLGFLGAHRFYLGFYKMGVAQIAVTALTQGYGVLWGFCEGVLLFFGHIDKDAKGRPLK